MLFQSLNSKADKTYTLLKNGKDINLKNITWNEIYVMALVNNDVYLVFEFSIKHIAVGSEYRFYNNGFYISGDNSAFIRLGVNDEWVTINTAILNGKNVTAGSMLYCWYR